MNWLIELFYGDSIAHTALIYALVIAVGSALGKIKVFGVSFGIACVLFAGLLIGYLGMGVDDHILHFVKEFGLILFVYTIGLQVGPGFFDSLKREGLTLNLLAASVVIIGSGLTVILALTADVPMSTMVGIMSGAVTNTPGLGAAQQAIKDSGTAVAIGTSGAGYAIAYPFGVLGIILIMMILKQVFRINLATETILHSKKTDKINLAPSRISLIVTNPLLFDKPIKSILDVMKTHLVVTRILHDNEIHAATKETILRKGDSILIVAKPEEFSRLRLIVGEDSPHDLFQSSGKIVARRISVTQKSAYGKKLCDLNITTHFGATLTRIQRAGVEFIPDGQTKLQFGDSVNAIGEEDNIELLAKAFGNSKVKLREPMIAPVFFGIVLGVILGSIPFYIPGIPAPIKLGLAGGPLIVAILISRYGGRFSVISYVAQSANLMVREIGIVLFLASVGISSGPLFVNSLKSGEGWVWMGLGALITVIPIIIVGLIARYWVKLNYFEICGLLAGSQTDPPALAFANQVTGSEAPSATYATVYPLTTVLRILMAQLLILIFL